MLTKTVVFENQEKAHQVFTDWAAYFSSFDPFYLQNFERDTFFGVFASQTLCIETLENAWQKLIERTFFDDSSIIHRPLWSGYLSYEMGLESHNLKVNSNSPLPYASLNQYALYFVLDQKKIQLLIDPNAVIKNPEFLSLEFWNLHLQNPPQIKQEASFLSLDNLPSKESFIEKVKLTQEAIKRGDIYQINLSTPLKFKTKSSPFALYTSLYSKNPTRYGCYLNVQGHALLCLSPELFLSHFNQTLLTQPIKGTIRKGKTALENERRIYELRSDPKETAELMMICDLMRNDLAKISEVGSVTCSDPRRLVELTHLFHMESVIDSKPLKHLHPLEMIQSCFPPGSISGCPKKSALIHIQTLEKRLRGPYCGAIGTLYKNGDFEFNVAIRLADYYKESLTLQVGCGITIDSDPEKEYEECLLKAKAFMKLLEEKNAVCI